MAKSLMPLAEHFHSVQGEGTFVGAPMHFIRLAGCSVGAAATRDFKKTFRGSPLPILSTGSLASKCRAYDGRFFTCDTDFDKHESISVESLLAETYEQHICLTGGEPLIHLGRHYFDDLLEGAKAKKIRVHIETSGTIYDEELFNASSVWIAVAPKFSYNDNAIAAANEVKLLVDAKFDITKVPSVALEHSRVFLSPINDELSVDRVNLEKCLKLLKQYPHWRLSCQWHKFLQVR